MLHDSVSSSYSAIRANHNTSRVFRSQTYTPDSTAFNNSLHKHQAQPPLLLQSQQQRPFQACRPGLSNSGSANWTLPANVPCNRGSWTSGPSAGLNGMGTSGTGITDCFAPEHATSNVEPSSEASQSLAPRRLGAAASARATHEILTSPAVGVSAAAAAGSGNGAGGSGGGSCFSDRPHQRQFTSWSGVESPALMTAVAGAVGPSAGGGGAAVRHPPNVAVRAASSGAVAVTSLRAGTPTTAGLEAVAAAAAAAAAAAQLPGAPSRSSAELPTVMTAAAAGYDACSGGGDGGGAARSCGGSGSQLPGRQLAAAAAAGWPLTAPSVGRSGRGCSSPGGGMGLAAVGDGGAGGGVSAVGGRSGLRGRMASVDAAACAAVLPDRVADPPRSQTALGGLSVAEDGGDTAPRGLAPGSVTVYSGSGGGGKESQAVQVGAVKGNALSAAAGFGNGGGGCGGREDGSARSGEVIKAGRMDSGRDGCGAVAPLAFSQDFRTQRRRARSMASALAAEVDYAEAAFDGPSVHKRNAVSDSGAARSSGGGGSDHSGGGQSTGGGGGGWFRLFLQRLRTRVARSSDGGQVRPLSSASEPPTPSPPSLAGGGGGGAVYGDGAGDGDLSTKARDSALVHQHRKRPSLSARVRDSLLLFQQRRRGRQAAAASPVAAAGGSGESKADLDQDWGRVGRSCDSMVVYRKRLGMEGERPVGLLRYLSQHPEHHASHAASRPQSAAAAAGGGSGGGKGLAAKGSGATAAAPWVEVPLEQLAAAPPPVYEPPAKRSAASMRESRAAEALATGLTALQASVAALRRPSATPTAAAAKY